MFNRILRDDGISNAILHNSHETNVAITTLYSCRERIHAILRDIHPKDTLPQTVAFFPDDIEEPIAISIPIDFVEPGRSLMRAPFRPLILFLVPDLVAQSILPVSCLNFGCSKHFLWNFLQRAGLSFRRARTEGRPAIGDAECCHIWSGCARHVKMSRFAWSWISTRHTSQNPLRLTRTTCRLISYRTTTRLKWLKCFGEHYGNTCNKKFAARLLLES
jgi:hypothetical protein